MRWQSLALVVATGIVCWLIVHANDTMCARALYEIESLARVLTHTHVMERLGGVVLVQILLFRQDLDMLCVGVGVTW